MEETFVLFLKSRKNRTVLLSELEDQVSGDVDYSRFAQEILNLEEKKVLARVKANGENHKNPSLAITYRINKSLLQVKLTENLKRARLYLHPMIDLETYFRLPEEHWEKDRPFLEKVDQYIRRNGFPEEQVPAPERSFELVEDEKWITEGGGQEILERIGVWNLLKMMPVSDPLMFALNPLCIQNEVHRHLIVENKTTYQGLLPALQDTSFTTLIYGSGKKIVKSIEQFDLQLPLQAKKHLFYYFGDLDYEGILIWYSLSKKIPVLLALPFYEACLRKPYAFGKLNQRPNEEALQAFVAYLNEVNQEKLKEMFQNGGYYPQEIIKTNELQHIWRKTSWK